MKNNGSISKYFLSDGSKLSVRNRILFGLILITPLGLLSGYLYHISGVFYVLEVYLAFLVFVLPLLIHFIFIEWFYSRYGGHSNLRFGYTYQHTCVFTLLYIPGIVAIILLWTSQVYRLLGILISLSFVVPFFSKFRINVFNDSSCYIGEEVVLGYPPFYNTFSLIVGLFGFYNVYNLLNVNFNNAILLFAITVIFQVIFVIPNWINKIVPFEIRRKEGFILNIILISVCYLLISLWFMGSRMFYQVNIDLTPEGIIRKIITYGIGIIFVILIIRLGRNMEKKEK
ncbi:hypothetical protein [uncultured Methanobrevibacter sp.]|uniref:hypothetical protein n=1 Tax=uncultured Methanobrevibacter sp. TaxID=253161 RepID=UPI002615392B|nr:hypothetical protein [uncultured Methanobrevibacter sp.]